MSMEDVLGFVLDDALNTLGKDEQDVTIIMTKPPRGNPDGPGRVVKAEKDHTGKVVLTVACEERGKGGVLNGLQNNR